MYTMALIGDIGQMKLLKNRWILEILFFIILIAINALALEILLFAKPKKKLKESILINLQMQLFVSGQMSIESLL